MTLALWVLNRDDARGKAMVRFPAGRRSVHPAVHSDDRRPSAAELLRRSCPRDDQIGQRQPCGKFLGTTDTVLCYRQTLGKPVLLPQTLSRQHVCKRGGFFCLQIRELSGLVETHCHTNQGSLAI